MGMGVHASVPLSAQHTVINKCHGYSQAENLFPSAVIFLSVYSYYTYYKTISMKRFIIMRAAEIRSCACAGCWYIAHSLILFKGLDQLKPYPNTLSLKVSYGFNASKIHPGTISLTNWKEKDGWDFWWHLGLVACTLSRGELGAQKVPSSQAGSSQAQGAGSGSLTVSYGVGWCRGDMSVRAHPLLEEKA